MGILTDISDSLIKGKANDVKVLVAKALEGGEKPADVLNKGLLLSESASRRMRFTFPRF